MSTPNTMSRGWMRMLVAAGLAAFAVATARPLAAQEFKVIVNSANPVGDLSSADVAKLFLKEASNFPGGAAATPVEPAKGSPVRAAFAKSVLGRTVQKLDTYWQQQIFSGKDVPPASKATDDEVVAFVKANPGAIGYVGASTGTAGVKVVAVR